MWPEFLHHADDYHWGVLSKRSAIFQLLFISGSDFVGVGHTVPLHWNFTPLRSMKASEL